MQDNIHPTYHQTKVACGCGNSFVVGSTKKELEVEICSACHPFYTGEKNTLDSAGRVERFKKMQEQQEKAVAAKAKAKKKAATKKVDDKKTALKDLKKK